MTPSAAQEQTPTTVAAVDLGSNSFHMVVAKVVDGRIRVVDRLKEMVRLAAGLDDNNNLSPEAEERALACLQRFGQRVRALPDGAVRAVGTNTLRKARGTGDFLQRACEALGHPIEIIAGREEARLIYLGVSHSLSNIQGNQFVMDIGGGSTEIIIGQGFEPVEMESLYMGCVSMSRMFFADGRIDADRMRRAEIAARLELQPVEGTYRRIGWQRATGASGTIRAVRQVVRANDWSDSGITLTSLYRLREALVAAGSVDKLKLEGLREERGPVFPGGVAILIAAFEALGIERMRVSDGALREGLVYDMLGRIRHEDVRERTIAGLKSQYRVDVAQARRVEETALHLLGQVVEPWGLGREEDRHLLAWAARLHELGLAVAHSQYHKHGAYLLENSDLPGFSRQEQHLLALLVRAHRRKVPVAMFKALPGGQCDRLIRLAVLLRLASLLQRSHMDVALPAVSLSTGKKSLRLQFEDGWLDEHPLTREDLDQEAAYLKVAKFALAFA